MSVVITSSACLYKKRLLLIAPGHFLLCLQFMMVCCMGCTTRSKTLPNNSREREIERESTNVICALQAVHDSEFETNLVGG